MSKSNYLENKVLDHILGATVFTAPATVYVALFTTDPTDAASGTEVTGNNYARKSVVNNVANWPNASGGTKSNGAEILFATPSGSWGTITHFAIYDALTVGNMLYHGALNSSVAPGAGVEVKFAAGALTVNEG